MTTTLAVAPVRKTLRVNADPERAFAVFTAGMGAWWPRRQTINASPIEAVVVEPRIDGRWYERGVDGSEAEWGRVLAWEPPGRLVLAWQITPEWRFDRNFLSEIEVRFTADGDGTLVELEHRLDGYGEQAAAMRDLFDAPHAWAGTLESFGDALD